MPTPFQYLHAKLKLPDSITVDDMDGIMLRDYSLGEICNLMESYARDAFNAARVKYIDPISEDADRERKYETFSDFLNEQETKLRKA